MKFFEATIRVRVDDDMIEEGDVANILENVVHDPSNQIHDISVGPIREDKRPIQRFSIVITFTGMPDEHNSRMSIMEMFQQAMAENGYMKDRTMITKVNELPILMR